MRRLLGGLLLALSVGAWGCEQQDTPAREADGGVAEGGGGYGGVPLGGFPDEDQTEAPDNVFNDFGRECSPPDGCDSEAADWPDCLNAGCRTGDCTYPGLADDYGYCTRGCTRDDECQNAVDGPYGNQFVCLTDGTSGTCVPGSGERCDLLANGQCADDGEICRWGVIYAPDQNYGGTCQPPTLDGRDTGESCNETEGIFCANDLCLFDTCTSLCDPNAAPENSPCPPNWTCFRDFDIGVTLDVCLPAYCESNADCGDGTTCVLTYEFNSDTVLRGICLPTNDGEAQPGEVCTDERPCQGATCFGPAGEPGYCSGLCDSDADCGQGAYCDIINFTIDDAGNTAPAQICVEGERTGSGRPCATDADCGASDDIPAEACEYFTRGDLEAGRYTSPPALAGRCSEIQPNSVEFAGACTEEAPCRTESLCLTAGNQNFCSKTCVDSTDCAGRPAIGGGGIPDGICFAIDFGGGFGGICVTPELIGLSGSIDPCVNDAECDGAETCQLNYIDSDRPRAELLCLEAPGNRRAGADCTASEQCASADCQPRSNDATAPGYCRASCAADADCGQGFTCEQVRPGPGSNRVGLCRPTDTCQPCTFDGTQPCGGEATCGLVNFDNRGDAGACLAACNGADDLDCPEGFLCQRVVNGAGEETGTFGCTPLRAQAVCADAAPPL